MKRLQVGRTLELRPGQTGLTQDGRDVLSINNPPIGNDGHRPVEAAVQGCQLYVTPTLTALTKASALKRSNNFSTGEAPGHVP